ncbi:hypothetical protein FVE85_2571 [Porphyridium purpureum]|uniref:Uncharacterized protein n=1 Tax=Porphyridium purpureum TaxID=35688 RepID=A0A5J4YJH1_PORPP|nr:hypothetical protein FVE85_2571 [Porphyridium purpureum]|eukprot:POR8862..scf291_13
MVVVVGTSGRLWLLRLLRSLDSRCAARTVCRAVERCAGAVPGCWTGTPKSTYADTPLALAQTDYFEGQRLLLMSIRAQLLWAQSQGFLDCAERVRAFGRANMQQAMGCMELAADGGEFTTTHEMQHLDSPLGALIQSEEELRDTIKGMVDNDFYKDFFENDENDEDEVYDWLSQLVTTSERHLVELTDARNDILEVEDRANPETPHQDEEPEN